MAPVSELDARLNDALSDLMTRNYVAIVAHCLQTPEDLVSEGADVGRAFCNLHNEAQRENWDALRVALGSTAIYLSSHIALALSTLPHVDDLWVDTPHRTLDQRVARMKEYKPVYDAFNAFLAANIDTVASALDDAGLLRGSALMQASQLADRISPIKHAFALVRDEAFDAGIKLALLTPTRKHPWTVLRANGSVAMAEDVVHAPRFSGSWFLVDHLARLRVATAALRTFATTPISGIMGAHTFESLRESQNTCEEKATTLR
jgi:hypothetical protein